MRLALAVLGLHGAAAWAAGDTVFSPGIEWLETWTNNATGASDGTRTSGDLLTTIGPRLLAESQGARTDLRADLSLRHTSYAGHSAAAQWDRLVDASGRVELVTGLLGIDGTAGARRVNQSLLAPQSSEGLGGNPNQSQVRSWQLAPRLDNRLGEHAVSHLAVTHSDFASDAAGGAFDARSDSVDERLASTPGSHPLSGSLHLFERRYRFRAAPDSSESRVLASGDARLDEGLHALASLGHENWSLPGASRQTAGLEWQAGLRWQPSALDSASATWGHRFFGRTWSFDLAHHGHLSFVSARYGEDVVTTQASFQVPAGADAVTFLAGLLSPGLADPRTRTETARNLASQLHLASSYGVATGFVTTATFLERALDLRAGYHSPRATLVASGFRQERVNLAGLQLLSIGDFSSSRIIRTAGIGLAAGLQPTARMTLGVGAQSSRVSFDDTGRTDRQFALSAGGTEALDRASSLSVQLQHLRRESNDPGNGYHEATLRVSFEHRF